MLWLCELFVSYVTGVSKIYISHVTLTIKTMCQLSRQRFLSLEELGKRTMIFFVSRFFMLTCQGLTCTHE